MKPYDGQTVYWQGQYYYYWQGQWYPFSPPSQPNAIHGRYWYPGHYGPTGMWPLVEPLRLCHLLRVVRIEHEADVKIAVSGMTNDRCR